MVSGFHLAFFRDKRLAAGSAGERIEYVHEYFLVQQDLLSRFGGFAARPRCRHRTDGRSEEPVLDDVEVNVGDCVFDALLPERFSHENLADHILDIDLVDHFVGGTEIIFAGELILIPIEDIIDVVAVLIHHLHDVLVAGVAQKRA